MSEVDKTVESTTSKPKMPVQKPLMEMGTAIKFDTRQYPVTLDGKQESEELAQSKGTGSGVFDVKKHKFGGKKTVVGKKHNEIANHLSAVRKEFNEMSLSLGLKGVRFLPNSVYNDIIAILSEGKAKWEQLVDEFVDVYKEELTNGNIQAELGSQFDPNNYPDPSVLPEVVKSKYVWIEAPFTATPKIDKDVLTQYTEQVADTMQVQANNYWSGVFDDAKQRLASGFMQYINDTLHQLDRVKQYREHTGKFYHNGTDVCYKDENGLEKVAKQPPIPQGLIDNAKTLAKQLDSLNIWDDDTLKDARVRILNLLNCIGDDRKKLADSPILQQQVANEVSKIQSDFADKFKI